MVKQNKVTKAFLSAILIGVVAVTSMGVEGCSDGPGAPIWLTGSPNPASWATNPTTVTFTSTGGSGSVIMGSSVIGGSGAANYSIVGDTCNGKTIPFGGSCTVTVSRTKSGTSAHLDVRTGGGAVVGTVAL
jgi:hypothetical protein